MESSYQSQIDQAKPDQVKIDLPKIGLIQIPTGILCFSWLWLLTFWIVCIAIPVIFILLYFFRSDHLGSLFFDPAILSIVEATILQAFCSTVISGIIGLPLGLWFGSQAPSRLKNISKAVLTIPYGVPTVVAGIAWIGWLGRNGILAQLGWNTEIAYSLKAVILASVFFNIPLVALLVAQTREYLVQNEIEAALVLGANRLSQFRWVIWPQVKWSFLSACSQVFVLCSMSFALVLILGGGPPVQTLETEIFARLRFGSLDLPGAGAVAFWELLITLVPWGGVLWFQNRQKNSFSGRFLTGVQSSSTAHPFNGGTGAVRTEKRTVWNLFGTAHFILALVFVLPYFCVFNFKSLSLIFDPAWRLQIAQPLQISFILAGISSLASVFTAMIAVLCLKSLKTSFPQWEAWLGIALMLPSGISVLVLSLGVWLAYGAWVDPFEGNILILVALQATLFFPLAFRVFWPLIHSNAHDQIEAAVLLGASPVQAFRWIEWPRWRLPIFTALAGVAGASLGEVGAVSLFYSERLIPLPLLISRWMAQYRFEEAQFVGGILLLISSLTILGTIIGSRYVLNTSRH